MENWLAVFKLLNTEVPSHPAFPLLFMYPRNLKPCPHKKLHANIYSQFAIAKTINNTMQQQVNGKQFLILKKYTQYFIIKRDKVLLVHPKIWINLRFIKLGERSQIKKETSYNSTYT